MAVTLQNVAPIGLCIATEDLFDARRFQQNFCDNLLLRARDRNLEPKIISIKREINSSMTQRKFFDGYKAVIINNIDKILSIVSSRYAQIDLRSVEAIIAEGKRLIDKVLNADSFDKITQLESEFKSKITLPVYELFAKSLR